MINTIKEDKIRDKDINFKNYASYKSAIVFKSGKAIRFIMAGGKTYDVPVSYIVTWSKEPHRRYVKGKWREISQSEKININKKGLLALRCRRILLNTVVRVYFNNCSAYDVPWDTLLMACEKAYEHFGGLTSISKKIVSDYHSKA